MGKIVVEIKDKNFKVIGSAFLTRYYRKTGYWIVKYKGKTYQLLGGIRNHFSIVIYGQ